MPFPNRTLSVAAMSLVFVSVGACRPVQGDEPAGAKPGAAKAAVAANSSDQEPDLSQGEVTFLPGVPGEVEVKRTPTGHLLVRPIINGKQPGWFIFDTGAGICVVSTPHVADFNLTSSGHIDATGVGGAAVKDLYRADTMVLGPVSLTNHPIMSTDLSFLKPFLQEEIVGVIGYGVLSRCIFEIDLATPKIALRNPAGYTLRDGDWSKLEILHRIPVVLATCEGHEGRFRLDTGANEFVMVHAPAVRRWGMLEGRQDLKDVKMGGVGGFVKAKKGVLSTFSIGDLQLEHIPATFSLADKGSMAESEIDGTLGTDLLRPYDLVLDYAGGRIAVIRRPDREPNKDR